MIQKRKIIHVSFQDPNHMTGGQGVSNLDICKVQLKLGYDVDYISLKISGEKEDQSYSYPEGTLVVHRIAVSDSDIITTPYAGQESRQHGRREEFYHKVTHLIKEHYRPNEVFIHLHGFYYVPLIAGALADYNVSSTYNLLLTSRMDRTGEHTDPLYDLIKMFEIVSFYANRKIQAITPGMKDEILGIAACLKDPYYRNGAIRLVRHLGVEPFDIERLDSLEDRIEIVPHGVGEEFLNAPPTEAIPNRVVAWGRTSPEKGFEYLIDAAKLLNDIKFFIYGTSGDSERSRGEYRVMLEQRASGLSNVKLDFRPEGVRGKELIDFIDSGEIVVMPSLYEPFGLINVEALARRKPVITTTTSGGRFIMNTETPTELPYGYVIDNNCNNLTQNIAKSLSAFFRLPKEKKNLMGQSAFERAGNFRWERIIQKIIDMYLK